MRFEAFSFGSSSDRRRHGRDLVIDHGEVMEVKGDAERHGIELVVLPTVESRRHQRHRAYDFAERSVRTRKAEAAK
jgi:hypothetical protein